jgi:hypothetical protein
MLPGCSTSALGGLKRQPARERGAARARRVGTEPQKPATSALLPVGELIRSQRRRGPQACLRARLPIGTRAINTRGRQPRTAGARQPAAQRSAAGSACRSLPPPSRAPHTVRARRTPQTCTRSRAAARNRGCGACASAGSTARFIRPTLRCCSQQRRRLPQIQERCAHARPRVGGPMMDMVTALYIHLCEHRQVSPVRFCLEGPPIFPEEFCDLKVFGVSAVSTYYLF